MSNDNAVAIIMGDIMATRDAFNACLVDRSLNFEAEAGFAIQILSGSEFALKVARNNRQSVVDAVTNVAAIGLTLNPAKKLSYLVPRKNAQGKMAICLDLSYMGLVDLAISDGAILLAQARTVHELDSFKDNGPGLKPDHSFNPFSKERGPVVGYYVTAKLPSGDFVTEIMSISEVNDIRDKSEAWKAYAAKEIKSCPWSEHADEMGKKTVVKRGAKYWRGRHGGGRIEQAIHYLNTDGGGGLAQDNGAPRVSGFDPQLWVKQVNAARSLDEVVRIHAEAMGEAAKTQDREGAAIVKAAAKARRDELAGNIEDANIKRAA